MARSLQLPVFMSTSSKSARPVESGRAAVADEDRAVTSEVRVRRWAHRGGRSAWPASAHRALEVARVEAGSVSYRIGTGEVEVGPGGAIVVPPRTDHATSFGDGARATSVWLGLDMVASVGDAMSTAVGSSPILLPRGGRVATLLGLLDEEVCTEGPGKLLAVEALAEALVVAVLRLGGGESRRPAARDTRIEAALETIDRDYAEPLTVETLSSAAGLSRFHFSRLFRDQVEESPYRYLLGVRLERAAELLRGGRHGVTETALTVGFQDLGRFSRSFAARFGALPSAYAARQGARSAPSRARIA